MGKINESIFREDMALRNAVEYLDDLDAGKPLPSVTYDYAREQVKKALGALLSYNGWWERTSDITARLTLKMPMIEKLHEQVNVMIDVIMVPRLGYTFKPVEPDPKDEDVD